MGAKLSDIVILRVIAVMTLVMWHCYCSYIHWNIAITPANEYYKRLFTTVIPDANLPLFTFIAGYLFFFLRVEKKKYNQFKDFLLNKVHRLLIPFLILGTIINLLEYGKNFIDVFYGLPNHLWYCLMLFYVYIIFWLLDRHMGKRWNMLMAIVSSCVVCIGIGPFAIKILGGAFLPFYYFVYFWYGYQVRKHHVYILNYQKTILSLMTILYMISIIWNNNHLLLIRCMTYITILYIVVNDISERIAKSKMWPVFDKISIYSFGVYVFHQWIVWNVTRTPVVVNAIRPTMETHYILFPACFYILVFLVSMGLTGLSLKTSIGRYLLC